MMSSFLSPDNYMQDPLKYVDPSGNRYFGYDEAAIYKMMEAMQQQVFHEWYSVYAAAAESVQLTVNMACGLYSHGLDTHGNGSGNHGSPGGEKTFLEAFKELCKTHGIEYEPGKPIPAKLRTDAFLKEFQEVFFPEMPMEYVLELSIHGYVFEKKDEGVTIAQQGNDLITGYSRVYFNENYVFDSPESMFYIMGHEFVHVSQNMELMGEDYSLLNTIWMNDVKEFHAYQWDQDMGKRHYKFEWRSNDNNIMNYIDRLKYSNFYWLINIIHP